MGQPADRPQPPPVDPAIAARVVLACTFCRDALPRGQGAFCAVCLAPHHAECFREHGRCGAPGCGERRVVRPAHVAPRVRPWLLVLALLGGFVASSLDHVHRAWTVEVEEQRRQLALLRAKLGLAAPRHDDAGARAREVARLTREVEVEGLLQEVERRADGRDIEGLITALIRLRVAMDAARDVVPAGTRARWNERLGGWGEGCSLSVELQSFISEGNRSLRVMAAGLRADDLDRVDVGARAIGAIAADMRTRERGVFHRNADAMEARARALSERARALRRAADATGAEASR